MTQGNVLLMGGTGVIGQHLSQALAAKGYGVFCTSRRRRVQSDSVTYREGNARDLDWIESLCAEIRPVAIFDFMIYSPSEFTVRHHRLLNLGAQYFFFSSYRVYADETDLITEQSPRKVDLLDRLPELILDTYGCTKGKQEDTLFESRCDNWTIIRPSMTFGANRFQFGAWDNFDVVRAVRGGTSMLPDSMVNVTSALTYAKDVATMLVPLIQNDRALRSSFNTVTGENHTWEEISHIYGEVFGLKELTVDEATYLRVGNARHTMIDRRMRRAFDNSFLLDVTRLSASEFHTLKEGLAEAWVDSDHERFKNTATALEDHARVDIITQNPVSLRGLPPHLRRIYEVTRLRARSEIHEAASAAGTRVVTMNYAFWKLSELGSCACVQRTDTDVAAVKGNKWVSFRLPITLKAAENYRVKIDLDSNVTATATLFVHGLSEALQTLEKVTLRPGRQTVEVSLQADNRWTYLALTAADFPRSDTRLVVRSVKVAPLTGRETVDAPILRAC